MLYYIDAYNLLFKMNPPQKNLEAQRNWLIKLLSSLASQIKAELIAVFDGADGDVYERTHVGALELVYTSEKQCADSFIVEEISRRENNKLIIVVTSDKGLAHQCNGLGVSVMSAGDFLKQKRRFLYTNETILNEKSESPSFLNDYYQKIFEKRLQNQRRD